MRQLFFDLHDLFSLQKKAVVMSAAVIKQLIFILHKKI